MSASLLLVGCGTMGSALAGRWLASGLAPSALTIIAPRKESARALADRGVTVLSSLAAVLEPPACVVFAVKPQIMEALLPDYRGLNSLFVSLAAGVSLSRLAGWLGADARLIRMMPNTPVSIGEGVSIGVAGPCASPDDTKQAEALFTQTGAVFWLADESLMDAATAISGSGPAYLYYFMECWSEAAVSLGLPPELAHDLVQHTARGSLALLQQSGQPLGALRTQVTSKGGTTEAALHVFSHDQALTELFRAATQRAVARARELNS